MDITCNKCGRIISSNLDWCPECGSPVNKIVDNGNLPKKKKRSCMGCFFSGLLISFIMFALLILLVILTEETTPDRETTPKTDNIQHINYNYSILREEPNKYIRKDSLDILLEKKVDKQELTKIAQHLRSSRKHYDRLFICYYLPKMEIDNGAWAISHFTPERTEIKILGSTAEEDKKAGNTDNVKGEIIGKWRRENTMGITYVIYKTLDKTNVTISKLDLKSLSMLEEVVSVPKNTFIRLSVYKDGTKSNDILTVSKIKNKIKYSCKNDHGEYFQIEKNGNLGLYDNDGKYEEAIKID